MMGEGMDEKAGKMVKNKLVRFALPQLEFGKTLGYELFINLILEVDLVEDSDAES